ncbi:MAG: hypothetical protein ACKOXB_13230 [Flavobacteriales bacterium]
MTSGKIVRLVLQIVFTILSFPISCGVGLVIMDKHGKFISEADFSVGESFYQLLFGTLFSFPIIVTGIWVGPVIYDRIRRKRLEKKYPVE